MANTPNYNLYKPNRLDAIPVDTSLSDNFTIIDTEIKNRQDNIDAHIASSTAHTSTAITHEGSNVHQVLIDTNARIDGVSDDIAEVDDRVSTIIADSGTSSTEVVDARGGYTVLGDRLDAMDDSIAPILVHDSPNFTIDVSHTYNPGTPLEYWITTITPNTPADLTTLVRKSFAQPTSGVFDPIAKEAPLFHADRVKGIVAINASGWDSGGTEGIDGIQIKDGVVYQNTTSFHPEWYTLGMKSDGLLEVYENTLTGADLLADGVVNSWSFTIPIIQNGLEVSPAIYALYSSYNVLTARQIIGQIDGTNEIVILTCDKSTRSQGMTLPQAAAILLGLNCRIAYCLDGGGSAQTIYKGQTLNQPSDGTFRPTSDLLYITQFDQYDSYLDVQKTVSDATGGFETLRDKINATQLFKLTVDDGTVEYTNNVALDYNTIKGTKFFRHFTDLAHAPNDSNAPFPNVAVDVYGVNIQSSLTSACQFVLDRTSGSVAYRFNNIGTWGSWRTMHDKVVWIPATLLNSWVNLGGSDPVAQYCLKDGIVYIKGVIKGGAASTVAFNLPVGMRPITRHVAPTTYNNGSVAPGRLFVNTNGDVTMLDAASAYSYISTSFPAEQ